MLAWPAARCSVGVRYRGRGVAAGDWQATGWGVHGLVETGSGGAVATGITG